MPNSSKLPSRAYILFSIQVWKRRLKYRRAQFVHYTKVKINATKGKSKYTLEEATALKAKWGKLLYEAENRLEVRRAQLAEYRKEDFRPKIVDLNLVGYNRFGPLGPITGVIGHYTAGPIDRNDQDAFALWRMYNGQHIAQGWAWIGYHYGVTAEGTIALLRPVTDKGAHTAGQNTGHVGIVMHGTTGDRATEKQAKAINWLSENAHTDSFPKEHRASRNLSEVKWTGHNDWNPTGCPGDFKIAYTSKGTQR